MQKQRSQLLRAVLATALVGSAATSCVVGAPPGFSDGDNWSVPLVAPLENDLLLVPVTIKGQGPFLFMIDPDAPESSIESSLQSSLKLYVRRPGSSAARSHQGSQGQISSTQRLTEADHLARILIVEIPKITIGDLSIRNLAPRVHDDGTFWAGNRRVHGVLGRDVISDSLIYQFDRDKGMMHIATQGHLKPNEGAKKLKFTQSYDEANRRYLAKFDLNRKNKLTMHLDLGARTSMMWQSLMKSLKMPSIPVQAELVDEYGTRRTANSGTMAGIIGKGDIEATAILMLPYGDKRLDRQDLDGVLGQNFWSKYNVTVNWHQKTFWLEDRNTDLVADAAERVARWGTQLDGCETVACLRPVLEGGKPPAPAPAEAPPASPADASAGDETGAEAAMASTEAPASVTTTSEAPGTQPEPLALRIDRDAQGRDFPYDAIVAAVDGEGALMDLPVFLASFPAGSESLRLSGLGPEYASAAKFVVLDINPVGTRGCEGSQCIFPMRNPQQ